MLLRYSTENSTLHIAWSLATHHWGYQHQFAIYYGLAELASDAIRQSIGNTYTHLTISHRVMRCCAHSFGQTFNCRCNVHRDTAWLCSCVSQTPWSSTHKSRTYTELQFNDESASKPTITICRRFEGSGYLSKSMSESATIDCSHTSSILDACVAYYGYL